MGSAKKAFGDTFSNPNEAGRTIMTLGANKVWKEGDRMLTGGKGSKALSEIDPTNPVQGYDMKNPGNVVNNTQTIDPSKYYDANPKWDISQVGPSGVDLGNYNQAAGFQSGLVNQLTQRAQGLGGPSIAQQQLSQNLGQNAAQQTALAVSSRGGLNPAMAARQALNANAAAGLQGTRDMSQLGIQEQLAAQSALGGAAGALRTGAMDSQGLVSSDTTQRDIANAGATNTGLQQQAGLKAGNVGLGLEADKTRLGMEQQRIRDQLIQRGQDINMATGQYNIDQDTIAKNAAFAGQLIQGVGSAATAYGNSAKTPTAAPVTQSYTPTGAPMQNAAPYQTQGYTPLDTGMPNYAMSDKRAKKDVKDGSKMVSSILDDLEQVHNSPKAAPFLLAAAAHLNNRLNKLEKGDK